MNKQELIAKIAKDTGSSKAGAAAAVDSLIDGITRSVQGRQGVEERRPVTPAPRNHESSPTPGQSVRDGRVPRTRPFHAARNARRRSPVRFRRPFVILTVRVFA